MADKFNQANGVDEHERDVCLDKPRTNGKNFTERTAHKLGVNRRGGLIILSLLLLVLILFIILIAVSYILGSDGSPKLSQVCRTSYCLESAAKLQYSLDASTPPCDDLYQYACGGWLSNKEFDYKSKWGVQEKNKHDYFERLRSFINLLTPVTSRSIEFKIKSFYESCMSTAYETFSKPILVKIIDQLGGWSVLPSWTLHSYDFYTVIRKLQYEYDTHPYFSVSVISDPLQPEKSIIRIKPGDLGLKSKHLYFLSPTHEIITDYQQYIKDTIKTFGGTSVNSERFSENIFFYEKRIAEVTPDSEDKVAMLDSNLRVSVSTLRISAASVPWLDILTAMYPSAGITEDTVILVDSLKYLISISQIISSTDKALLNGYLIWTLADKYLPYLLEEYSSIRFHFDKVLTGASEKQPRWEFCVEKTMQYFPFGLGGLYAASLSDRATKIFDMEKMALTISEVLQLSLSETNLPRHIMNSRIEKIKKFHYHIGYPSNFIETNFLSDYYEDFFVQKSDFFENLLNGIKFTRKKEERNYREPSPYFGIEPSLIADDVSYLYAQNIVVVPELFLSSSHYRSGYPRAVLYGEIGSRIATALSHAIDDFSLYYDSSGGLQNDSTIESAVAEVKSQYQCLTSNHNLQEAFDQSVLGPQYWSLIIGTEQAKRALLSSLDENEKRPSMEFDHSTTYFLSLIQMECLKKTDRQTFLDQYISQRSEGRNRVNVLTNEVSGMMSSFGCSSPSGQCMLSL